MQVSIRELKNHLSQYLHQVVEANEMLIVTSYRKPLARIQAIPATHVSGLQDLIRLEGIHWNGKKPAGSKTCPQIIGASAADYVLEDRG